MDKEQQIILEIFSLKEYIEFSDELIVVKIFNALIENKNVFNNLKNNYIFINTGDKKFNTKIINWDIYALDADSEEFVNGVMNFRGSCNLLNFDDALMLSIKIENFKISEIWAVDMDDNTEVAFIEQSKYVKRMERETYKSGPQTYSNRYKFIFRGNI